MALAISSVVNGSIYLPTEYDSLFRTGKGVLRPRSETSSSVYVSLVLILELVGTLGDCEGILSASHSLNWLMEFPDHAYLTKDR